MYTCDLPSGKSVSVEPPEYSHRLEAVKEFRSLKEEVGYTLEELMAAKSIVAFDGKMIKKNFSISPIYLMSKWPNVDVQYYIEWYMTLFFADESLKNKAIEAAKKIMIGLEMDEEEEDQPVVKSKRTPAKV